MSPTEDISKPRATLSTYTASIDQVRAEIGKIILGKEHAIQLTLTCMIANGHILIEDEPGRGKTTLAQALAKVFALDFQRIQFTSDLLPADILGGAIYNQQTGKLYFRPGPIFAQFVLADEINRATPRAQSALLEAMSEEQINIEGEVHTLPNPFFVIATQNPNSQIGTFPLPESQLDRFLMCITLGYPDPAAERALWQSPERKQLLQTMQAMATPMDLLAWQQEASTLHVSDALLDYLQKLLYASRHQEHFRYGLSSRAGLDLLRCARAWAWIEKRDFVLPDDIQVVLPWVAGHRLCDPNQQNASQRAAIADLLIAQVPVN